ncbi:hypothetical protein NA56DRAFT_651951 [Hyaloscypha hepaticicola]|uniref:Uncharacterized protein n=1 Tax=Hyaloscypha hepaticicola TaxID=2082293 RepID=A0A2J6PGE9_9HELO|nr:hypothetical protein NA56DRAFT_651951 [Hyaloscypha hepaticicola]
MGLELPLGKELASQASEAQRRDGMASSIAEQPSVPSPHLNTNSNSLPPSPSHSNEKEREQEQEQTSRPSSSTQNSRTSLDFTKFPNPDTRSGPPPLSFNPWTKKSSIIICTTGLLFFDLILPCLVYYTLTAYTTLSIEINLGISCASLGLGELLELPLRGYRLYKFPQIYAPLNQTSKWGFDFLFWWYLLATIIGIVPYVISTSLDTPILWLFLFTPGFLALFASATAAISLYPFTLPLRVSSSAKGEKCKPFTYYILEDFISVDASQTRQYRSELLLRWDSSPIFRRLIWEVNFWWAVGGVVFTGALAGITWGCDFGVAYGLSFGVLFVWIGVWAAATWGWVRWRLGVEMEWFRCRAREIAIEGDREKGGETV